MAYLTSERQALVAMVDGQTSAALAALLAVVVRRTVPGSTTNWPTLTHHH